MNEAANPIIRAPLVTLQPISTQEAGAYAELCSAAALGHYLSIEPFQSEADALAWIRTMQQRADTSDDLTFSVYDNVTGALAGSSSYLDVRLPHRGLEIGFTWYGAAFQRTHVNTATKLALLEYAFETLSMERVQLQTDARNQRSQAAIARIGAQREGVLRRHKVCKDGFVRDSVLFSIVRSEWPGVRAQLTARLARG